MRLLIELGFQDLYYADYYTILVVVDEPDSSSIRHGFFPRLIPCGDNIYAIGFCNFRLPCHFELRDLSWDMIYLINMKEEFWAKLDAYLFKILGLALGGGGCMGLIMNNTADKLLHNTHGMIILLIFGAMAAYSLYSLLWDFFPRKSE